MPKQASVADSTVLIQEPSFLACAQEAEQEVTAIDRVDAFEVSVAEATATIAQVIENLDGNSGIDAAISKIDQSIAHQDLEKPVFA